MKILYVHDYGQPIGGAETLMFRLRDGMRRLGHDARLFTSNACGEDHIADYHGFGTTSRLRGLTQSANPFAANSLRRTLADFRPDVVHIGMFLTQLSPLILPQLRAFPTVYHAMWYRAVCPTGKKLLPCGSTCTFQVGTACLKHQCISKLDWLPMMAQLAAARRWLSEVDVVLPVSGSVKRELEAGGIGCGEVITLGVEDYERPHASIDPSLVGYCGRLDKEKGVDVLIRAFVAAKNDLPGAKLLIVGDGPKRRELQELAGLPPGDKSIEFAGHLSRPEVERRMAAVAMQVIPSTWHEPFGLVAPEAMLRGTPVIASRAGALGELVRDGQTGMLVPPGDVEALASALRHLLANPSIARALGAAGRLVALAEHGEALMLQRFEALYEKVISGRAARGAHRALPVLGLANQGFR